jgi:hypothetical protein
MTTTVLERPTKNSGKVYDFDEYINGRYEASFDRDRLVSAEDMHNIGRKMLNMEEFYD